MFNIIHWQFSMLYLELTEMLTTKSEEVFNFEWTYVNKHREAIVTGSSSLILVIALCVWLKLRKCNNRPRPKLKEKIDQPFELYSIPLIDDIARASYASLELDEGSDPDYEDYLLKIIESKTSLLFNFVMSLILWLEFRKFSVKFHSLKNQHPKQVVWEHSNIQLVHSFNYLNINIYVYKPFLKI